MTKDNEKLKDHSFDGIQEYDNPIPLWMSVIFWATIIFSVLYMPYYHFFGGDLPVAVYEKEMAAHAAARAEIEAARPKTDFSALLANPENLEAGKAVYASTCAACHGQNAEGLVGPGFLNNEWRNGDGSLASVIELVRKGVPDKGMPPWEMLGDEAVNNVSAYIYRLSNPEGNGGPLTTQQ